MADYNFLANPTLVDPVGAINKGLTAANAFHENQLHQAKRQAGEAFQSSINPDGSTNQAAFLQNIKANPAIAPFAQNAAQAGQTGSNEELATKIRRLTGISGRMIGLAGQNPSGISRDVMLKEIRQAAGTFGLPPEAVAKMEEQVTDDPMGNLRLVFRGATSLMGAGDAVLAGVGAAPLVDTGAGQAQAPMPSPMQIAGGTPPTTVDRGLSAADMTQRIRVVDQAQTLPDGRPNPNYGQQVEVTLGEWAQRNGIPLPPAGVRGGGPGAQPPGVVPRLPGAVPAPPASGSTPPAQTGAPAAQPAPVPASGPPPGAGRGVSLAPGATIPIEAANAGWAKAQQDMGTYTNRTFPLVQAIALEPGVTTGPMSERINTVKAFLVSRAGDFGVNPDVISNLKNTTADFEKLNKYLVQYTSSLPMAAGTDARLAQAVTGNPSVILSNLGLKEIAQAAMALERFNYAAALDFQERGAPNGQWLTHLTEFQRTHDPRAFLADIADPAKLRKAVQRMTPTERTAFMRTHQWVADHPDVMNKPTMPGR